MQHLMTSRDGRNLDVLLGGNPNASMALVCHHGTPSDASIWTGWNEDALEHNLRLVAISRPDTLIRNERRAARYHVLWPM